MTTMTAVIHGEPFTGNVLFTVTVRSTERDGRWMARALETGIIAYGPTRDEAEKNVGVACESIVARWKAQGRDTLEEYLTTHGVKYSLDGSWGHEPLVDQRSLAA